MENQNYIIKNKGLEKMVSDAESADGYMILITRINGEQLTHVVTTKTFKNEDILPSIDELSKQIEKEIK